MSVRSGDPQLDLYLQSLEQRIRTLEGSHQLATGTLSVGAVQVGNTHLSHDGKSGLLIADVVTGSKYSTYRLERTFSRDGVLTVSHSVPWKPPAGANLVHVKASVNLSGEPPPPLTLVLYKKVLLSEDYILATIVFKPNATEVEQNIGVPSAGTVTNDFDGATNLWVAITARPAGSSGLSVQCFFS